MKSLGQTAIRRPFGTCFRFVLGFEHARGQFTWGAMGGFCQCWLCMHRYDVSCHAVLVIFVCSTIQLQACMAMTRMPVMRLGWSRWKTVSRDVVKHACDPVHLCCGGSMLVKMFFVASMLPWRVSSCHCFCQIDCRPFCYHKLS